MRGFCKLSERKTRPQAKDESHMVLNFSRAALDRFIIAFWGEMIVNLLFCTQLKD